MPNLPQLNTGSQVVLFRSRRKPTTASQTGTRARAMGAGPVTRGKQSSVHLMWRDYEILQTLHTTRYLTTPQIQTLFWRAARGGRWGLQKACGRRLRKLVAAGLVRRIELPVRRGDPSLPYVYALDKKGAHILAAELGLDPKDVEWRRKNAEEHYPFLRHLLLTNDIRIAVLQACERYQLQLEQWIDEKELKRANMKDYVTVVLPGNRRQRAAVVPDAAFVIRAGAKTARFFVEIDNRTVTVAPSAAERRGWTRKIRAYVAYFASRAYHARYGVQPARVLTVTTGAVRLNHLQQATARAGGGQRFYFTTFDRATAGQILTQPIWAIAGAQGLATLLP